MIGKKEHKKVALSAEQKTKLSEYIFVSFVFCLLSGASKMGVFVIVLFVTLVTIFLFVCSMLWQLLLHLMHYVFDRWLRDFINNLRNFSRR